MVGSRVPARRPESGLPAVGHALGRLAEHGAENPDDLVQLRLARDEWRRDLDDRVAAVVLAADQAGLEQRR